MGSRSGPQHLSRTLSELIALRGLAQVRGNKQLQSVWSEISGEAIASQTRVEGIRRGILQVAVSNSALLSELASFHKVSLFEALQEKHPDLRIRDLKFRLRSDVGR